MFVAQHVTDFDESPSAALGVGLVNEFKRAVSVSMHTARAVTCVCPERAVTCGKLRDALISANGMSIGAMVARTVISMRFL